MALHLGKYENETSTKGIAESCLQKSAKEADKSLEDHGFEYIDSSTYLGWLRNAGSRPPKNDVFGMILLRFSPEGYVVGAREVTDSFFTDGNQVIEEYISEDGVKALYLCFLNRATSKT